MAIVRIYWLQRYRVILSIHCSSLLASILYLYLNLSVEVSKLQVAIIGRSFRIVCQHIMSRVRVSVRPSNFLYAKNTQKYREYRVAHAAVYLNEAPTGHL